MDLIEQLNQLTDPGLRELLTHSVRYGMQHNLIAAQCEASSEPAAQNAVVLHKDTYALIMGLVKQVLKDNPPPKPAPAKKPAKKK